LIGPAIPTDVANGAVSPVGVEIHPIRTAPAPRAPIPARKRPTGEVSTDRRAAPRTSPIERRPAHAPPPPPANGSGPGMRPRRPLQPRLRMAKGPGTTLCRLPGADWWERLSSELEASDKSSHNLAEALLAQEQIAPLPSGAEAFPDPLVAPPA